MTESVIEKMGDINMDTMHGVYDFVKEKLYSCPAALYI